MRGKACWRRRRQQQLIRSDKNKRGYKGVGLASAQTLNSFSPTSLRSALM